jgi:hypothetical protein
MTESSPISFGNWGHLKNGEFSREENAYGSKRIQGFNL